MSEVTNADVDGQGLDAKGGKGGRNKLMIIGGAALALVLVAGGGAVFLSQSGSVPGSGNGEVSAVAEPYFLDLPDVVVNLNTGGAGTGYLRLRIALELGDASLVDLISPRMPRVLDAFQVYLRELRPSDLEGSAGIHRLKEELLRRVNLAVYPASVDDILFKEILIQ